MLMKEIMQLEFITDRECNTHLHQDLELIYILKGQCKVLLDQYQYDMEANDFLVINTNKKHSIIDSSQTVLGIRFMIDYQMLTEYMNTEHMLFWCNTVTESDENHVVLRRIMDQVLSLYFEGVDEEKFRIRSLMNEMLYILTSNFMVKTDKQREMVLTNAEDDRIIEIRNYILSNYQKQLSLNSLAKQMHLSNAYLSRYIKQSFGISFLEYLNNVRLFHAIDDLIYSDKKIINIAIDNGYSNPTAFNKAFRDAYQVSPTEYRSRARRTSPEEGKGGLDKDRKKEFKRILKQKKSGSQPTRYTDVERIIADARSLRPFMRVTNETLNVGDAAKLANSDVRDQIQFLQKQLHFKYIRIWNMIKLFLFKNKDGEIQCNYTKTDRILDFCMENHLIPHLEIGYKPLYLMEQAEKKIYGTEDDLLFDNLEEYRKCWKKWFIYLINRYGSENLEQWRFEMRADSRKNQFRAEVFQECFTTIKSLLKSLVPNIEVGGPGIILGYEKPYYDEVFSAWSKDAEPDFISVYSYGYDTLTKDDTYYVKKSRDSQYTLHQVEILKETLRKYGLEDKKIYITEWNFSISNRDIINDSCAMGAYVMQNLIQAERQLDGLAWWHATDLLTDYHDADLDLRGDNGILTSGGIPKPVYYAFEFFEKMQNQVVMKVDHMLITTNGRGSFAIVCHNCKKPSYLAQLAAENRTPVDTEDDLFENNDSILLKVQLDHVQTGDYLIKNHIVNQDHGSVLDLWQQMGSRRNLSRGEVEYLTRISVPDIVFKEVSAKSDVLNFELTLQPHEIRLIEIDYQYSSL